MLLNIKFLTNLSLQIHTHNSTDSSEQINTKINSKRKCNYVKNCLFPKVIHFLSQ